MFLAADSSAAAPPKRLAHESMSGGLRTTGRRYTEAGGVGTVLGVVSTTHKESKTTVHVAGSINPTAAGAISGLVHILLRNPDALASLVELLTPPGGDPEVSLLLSVTAALMDRGRGNIVKAYEDALVGKKAAALVAAKAEEEAARATQRAPSTASSTSNLASATPDLLDVLCELTTARASDDEQLSGSNSLELRRTRDAAVFAAFDAYVDSLNITDQLGAAELRGLLYDSTAVRRVEFNAMRVAEAVGDIIKVVDAGVSQSAAAFSNISLSSSGAGAPSATSSASKAISSAAKATPAAAATTRAATSTSAAVGALRTSARRSAASRSSSAAPTAAATAAPAAAVVAAGNIPGKKAELKACVGTVKLAASSVASIAAAARKAAARAGFGVASSSSGGVGGAAAGAGAKRSRTNEGAGGEAAASACVQLAEDAERAADRLADTLASLTATKEDLAGYAEMPSPMTGAEALAAYSTAVDKARESIASAMWEEWRLGAALKSQTDAARKGQSGAASAAASSASSSSFAFATLQSSLLSGLSPSDVWPLIRDEFSPANSGVNGILYSCRATDADRKDAMQRAAGKLAAMSEAVGDVLAPTSDLPGTTYPARTDSPGNLTGLDHLYFLCDRQHRQSCWAHAFRFIGVAHFEGAESGPISLLCSSFDDPLFACVRECRTYPAPQQLTLLSNTLSGTPVSRFAGAIEYNPVDSGATPPQLHTFFCALNGAASVSGGSVAAAAAAADPFSVAPAAIGEGRPYLGVFHRGPVHFTGYGDLRSRVRESFPDASQFVVMYGRRGGSGGGHTVACQDADVDGMGVRSYFYESINTRLLTATTPAATATLAASEACMTAEQCVVFAFRFPTRWGAARDGAFAAAAASSRAWCVAALGNLGLRGALNAGGSGGVVVDTRVWHL